MKVIPGPCSRKGSAAHFAGRQAPDLVDRNFTADARRSLGQMPRNTGASTPINVQNIAPLNDQNDNHPLFVWFLFALAHVTAHLWVDFCINSGYMGTRENATSGAI